MSSAIRLRSSARLDIRDAALWYDTQRAGLGEAFLGEVDVVFGRIVENPLQFPEICVDVRRVILRRFPYGVYFVPSREHPEVIAVLHLHRDPEAWRRRI